MEEKILKNIYESLYKNEKAALVTLTDSVGSAPRKKGSIMAVWESGKILGSVGGGEIELKIISEAVGCIEKNEDKDFQYSLTGSGGLGMQCGGQVKGFIKVFYPPQKLLIAGAGHIGEKLCALGKFLNFYTVVFDDREEFLNEERFGEANETILGDILYNLSNYNIDKNTYVVIITRSHEEDSNALKAVMSRDAKYIGMIGSVKKIQYIMKELIEQGVSKEDLKKVYTPIGLDIGSSLPEEIALGIIGEILLIKNNGSLNHRKNIKKIII